MTPGPVVCNHVMPCCENLQSLERVLAGGARRCHHERTGRPEARVQRAFHVLRHPTSSPGRTGRQHCDWQCHQFVGPSAVDGLWSTVYGRRLRCITGTHEASRHVCRTDGGSRVSQTRTEALQQHSSTPRLTGGTSVACRRKQATKRPLCLAWWRQPERDTASIGRTRCCCWCCSATHGAAPWPAGRVLVIALRCCAATTALLLFVLRARPGVSSSSSSSLASTPWRPQ